MITLIIFLLIVSILIVILRLFKLKIYFKIIFNNLNVNFKVNVFKKEFRGKLLLQEINKKENSGKETNKKVISKKGINISSAYEKVNRKPKEVIDLAKNIIGVLEIKRIDINLFVGLLFLAPTILSVGALSTLITTIYHLPFKEKGPLTFKVLPIYNKLCFKAKLEGEIVVSLFNILLILILLLNKKVFSIKKLLTTDNKNEYCL